MDRLLPLFAMNQQRGLHEAMATRDYFTKLPNELLTQIIDELDSLSDKFKLRLLLPKWDEKYVRTMLQPYCRTLCVSPTEASLEHFSRLCNSAFFSACISEVLYVASATEEDHRFFYPHTYRFRLSKVHSILPESCKQISRAMLKNPALMQQGYKEHCEFLAKHRALNNEDRLLRTLANGLAKLQTLETFVVHGGSDPPAGSRSTKLLCGPNWNEARLVSGFERCEFSRHEIASHEQEVMEHYPQSTISQHITERTTVGQSIFLQAVFVRAEKRPTSLQIGGRRRPHYDAYFQASVVIPKGVTRIMRKTLKRLRIQGLESANHPGRMFTRLASHAIALEELILDFDVEQSWPWPISHAFFTHARLPRLRILRILGSRDSDRSLYSSELLTFLENHRNLQEVYLDGLLLVELQPTAEKNHIYALTFSKAVKKIQEYMHLTELSILVPRKQEYIVTLGDSIYRSQLEALAEEFKVELKQGDFWDFGESFLCTPSQTMPPQPRKKHLGCNMLCCSERSPLRGPH